MLNTAPCRPRVLSDAIAYAILRSGFVSGRWGFLADGGISGLGLPESISVSAPLFTEGAAMAVVKHVYGFIAITDTPSSCSRPRSIISVRRERSWSLESQQEVVLNY